MSVLEQNIIRNKRVNKFLELELKRKRDKEYKFEAMKDSAAYNEVGKSQLQGLYYQVF